MKRIWHNYKKWEDFQHGMYDTTKRYSEKETDELAQKAVSLLSNPEKFYLTAKDMIDDWPIAAEVNLTTASRNFEAWVGQASCCYAHGVPEHITKQAWRLLKISEQLEANIAAQKIIDEWRAVNQS